MQRQATQQAATDSRQAAQQAVSTARRQCSKQSAEQASQRQRPQSEGSAVEELALQQAGCARRPAAQQEGRRHAAKGTLSTQQLHAPAATTASCFAPTSGAILAKHHQAMHRWTPNEIYMARQATQTCKRVRQELPHMSERQHMQAWRHAPPNVSPQTA